MSSLRAPFPWFGGKSRVAPMVWERLGDVQTYNEPFAGSLAVLLGRPTEPRVETVNDLDAYLANFWRAVQHDPDAVAYWADSPVNEADLHARHLWLVQTAKARAERVKTEPEYFDAQIAGWWVWGQCLWIGSGWCSKPEWSGRGNAAGKQAKTGINSERVQRKRPQGAWAASGIVSDHVGTSRWQGGGQAGAGSGVHALRHTTQQKPYLASGTGHPDRGVVTVSRQKPELRGDAGAAGSGIHSSAFDLKTGGLYAYMHDLAARLRRVRVCCGDWKRVLTPSVTTYIGVTGVFLDPPYSHDEREICYAEDHDISSDVRTWALEHGADPNMRIALCGYDGEHDMPSSWECVPWKAHGGYSRTERGVANRSRERIWFSPFCQHPDGMLQFDEPVKLPTAELERFVCGGRAAAGGTP